MDSEKFRGTRRTGNVVNLAAAGAANAAAIYQVSNFAQQVGTKSFKLRKIMIRSNAVGANEFIQIGTGVGGAFANVIPPIMVINNVDMEWQTFDLPEVEVYADLTAFPVALPAGTFDIQVEIEEKG